MAARTLTMSGASKQPRSPGPTTASAWLVHPWPHQAVINLQSGTGGRHPQPPPPKKRTPPYFAYTSFSAPPFKEPDCAESGRSRREPTMCMAPCVGMDPACMLPLCPRSKLPPVLDGLRE